MSASIIAEAALQNFDRFEVKQLEKKLNRNSRERKISGLSLETFSGIIFVGYL